MERIFKEKSCARYIYKYKKDLYFIKFLVLFAFNS